MVNINNDVGNGVRNEAERRRPRIFYGWWVVAAACVLGMFGNGSVSQGFPRFFTPIQGSLGLTSSQMSLVFSLARAEGSVAGPAIGWLVDRIGARPMILVGCITVGVGVILMSRANAYWMLLVLFAGFISLGKSAGFGQTLMAGVNQWFVRRRHIAMSTLMTAFAGGGAIVVPVLNEVIQWLGWRDTLLWTGIFILVLTLPVTLVIRSRPEDMGLRPDGDPPEEVEAGGSGRRRTGGGEINFTFREAIVTRTFWVFMVGAILRVSVTNGMLVHIFPMMTLRGTVGRRGGGLGSGDVLLGDSASIRAGDYRRQVPVEPDTGRGHGGGSGRDVGVVVGPGYIWTASLRSGNCHRGRRNVGKLADVERLLRASPFCHADGISEPVHEYRHVLFAPVRRVRCRPDGELLYCPGHVHAVVPGQRSGLSAVHAAAATGQHPTPMDWPGHRSNCHGNRPGDRCGRRRRLNTPAA